MEIVLEIFSCSRMMVRPKFVPQSKIQEGKRFQLDVLMVTLYCISISAGCY